MAQKLLTHQRDCEDALSQFFAVADEFFFEGDVGRYEEVVRSYETLKMASASLALSRLRELVDREGLLR